MLEKTLGSPLDCKEIQPVHPKGDCCCSVTKSCPTLCNPMNYSTPSSSDLHYFLSLLKFMLLSQWCHPIISPSVTPFSCPWYSPASESFPVSQLFTSGSQSTVTSVLALVLPLNIQDWFPLRLTGLIALESKGLWRVFSSATVWKHHFFATQPSLWSNSHIHAWLLEKP